MKRKETIHTYIYYTKKNLYIYMYMLYKEKMKYM